MMIAIGDTDTLEGYGIHSLRVTFNNGSNEKIPMSNNVTPWNETLGNKTLFAWKQIARSDLLSYFTKAEINSIPKTNTRMGRCDKKEMEQACCLGTISQGGGNARTAACFSEIQKAQEFFVQQFPVPYYTKLQIKGVSEMYNMHHVLKYTRGKQIMLLGDSVMNQNFDNLLCDIQRHTNTRVSIKYYTRERVSWNIGTALRGVVELSDFNTKIVFHREFRFHPSGLTIKEACFESDILLFNFGVHWNDMEEYRRDMKLLAKLLTTYCSGVKIIFRGSTSQHFPTEHGLFNPNLYDVVNYTKKYLADSFLEKLQQPLKEQLFFTGCQPIRDKNFQGRDDIAYESFVKGGITVYNALELDESEWIAYRASSETSILFIPFEKITQSLYNFHFEECTHYCNSPYVWSIIYHYLFKAIHEDINITTKQPLYVPKPWKVVMNKKYPDFQIHDFTENSPRIYKLDKP